MSLSAIVVNINTKVDTYHINVLGDVAKRESRERVSPGGRERFLMFTRQGPVEKVKELIIHPITGKLLISAEDICSITDDKTGNNLLIRASENNQTEIVKFLIFHFPSLLLLKDQVPNKPHIKPDGYTAIQIAAYNNRVEVINALLSSASDNESATRQLLTTVDNYGNLPLHTAVWCGHAAAAFVLLAGTPASLLPSLVSAVDKYENTALHKALHFGYLDCAKLLVAFGADINAKTKQGETPVEHGINQFAKLGEHMIGKNEAVAFLQDPECKAKAQSWLKSEYKKPTF